MFGVAGVDVRAGSIFDGTTDPTDLKEQLAEAEKDDKRACVRATKDGWSADELKKLGLENSAASRRRTAPCKSPQTPSPEHHNEATNNAHN